MYKYGKVGKKIIEERNGFLLSLTITVTFGRFGKFPTESKPYFESEYTKTVYGIRYFHYNNWHMAQVLPMSAKPDIHSSHTFIVDVQSLG